MSVRYCRPFPIEIERERIKEEEEEEADWTSSNPSTRGRFCRLGMLIPRDDSSTTRPQIDCAPYYTTLRYTHTHYATIWHTTNNSRVGTEMIIRLKWGQTEYKGSLESIDSYMNVLLRDTEEFIDGKNTGSLGLVLIRYASFTRDG